MVNFHIFTYSTDESRLHSLAHTAKINNTELKVISSNKWNGFQDKLTGLLNAIVDIPDDDIVCFIDAYDVLINDPATAIIEKFLRRNVDLIFSAELNCFPSKYKDKFKKSEWTNFHYLNSGGYIGYASSVKKFLTWKDAAEISELCRDGGDQAYAIEYYISNNCNPRIIIDDECEIFLSMFGIDWGELSIRRGKIYNDVLKNNPSFIHFNGGSWQSEGARINVLPGVVNKLQISQNSRSTLKIDEWKQLRDLAWPKLNQV